MEKLLEKKYKVKRTANSTKNRIAHTKEEFWSSANILNEFSSPWVATELVKTEFRALHDSEYFYFKFRVFDTDLHIDLTDNSKMSINDSDRVELFFRKDEQMNPYYCLEMDTQARLFDFIAYPEKKFDYRWNWPKNSIELEAKKSNQFFEVVGLILKSSLIEFGLLKDNRIQTGIFRAKYNMQSNGDYKPTWITWIDPNTLEPNFHCATAFGLLEFE